MTLQEWAHLATIVAPLIALFGLAWALWKGAAQLSEVNKQLELGRAQLEQAQKQLRDDHVYRRRAATIEINNKFGDVLGEKLGLSRRIIATLDKTKSTKLEKIERFELDAKSCGPLLLALFRGDEAFGLEFKEKGSNVWINVNLDSDAFEKLSAGTEGEVRLGLSHVATIRTHGVAYHNILETVFLAARLEVADQKEILDEFETLVARHVIGEWWEMNLSEPHSNLRWAKECYAARTKKHSADQTGI